MVFLLNFYLFCVIELPAAGYGAELNVFSLQVGYLAALFFVALLADDSYPYLIYFTPITKTLKSHYLIKNSIYT